VKAYEIALGSASLKNYCRTILAFARPKNYWIKSGADVSCEFYPDLAFELEKIPGRFIKI
jgi:hypothetical protein